MAVILNSNMPYRGNLADLPPINAPMPNGAAFYADFLNDLYITPDTRGADPKAIFDFSAARERFVANAQGGYARVAEGAAAGRVEHDAKGARVGLLLEGANSQMLALAQRTDLTKGTASGLNVVADGGTPENEWDRWYALAPVGDGAHSLQLASEASVAANHRRLFAMEVRPGTTGQRYVQLSAGPNGDAEDYANFDLQTMTVCGQGAGAVFAGIVPTQLGAICYVQYVSALAGIESPAVAIIGTATAAKLTAAAAASVGGVRVRLPKFVTNTGVYTRIPARSPMPSGVSAVLPDQLKLVAPSEDFTMLIRAHQPVWSNEYTPTLFAIAPNGSVVNGVSIRTTAGAPLAVVTRTSNTAAVAHTFATGIVPDKLMTFAVAKQGNVLRVALEGETYEAELPQIAGGAAYLLSSPVASEGFDGHLQRAIGWTHGKSLSEMQALVAGGL